MRNRNRAKLRNDLPEHIAFGVDAVPYFPFKLTPEGESWTLRYPLTGEVQELNAAAYRLLQLCDGYRTWGEGVAELARSYGVAPAEIEAASRPLLATLTEEGLLWWRRQRLQTWRCPPPPAVLWDLTGACNLACRHCVVAGGAARPDELSLDECLRVVDELAAFGVRELILSGGEPLLRPDFLAIAERAAGRGLGLQIATNATLVDAALAERLTALHANAQVSLDGATAAVHDAFRGCPGSWARAVQGIRYLVAAGVPVMLAATVTRANLAEIPALYALAAELGAYRFRILPFVPYGRGHAARALEVSPPEMREVTAYLHAQRDAGGLPVVEMEFECTFGPVPTGEVAPRTRIGCDGAVGYCTITAQGEVLPCNFFAGAEADNVRAHSFGWIWEHARFLNYFRSLTVDDLHGPCRVCAWLAVCRGSCVAANFAHGDLFQSNCHCWLAHPGAAEACAGAQE